MTSIYKMSSAGGMTSETRYFNMLTNYGDFGAMQRIASTTLGSDGTISFSNIPQTYQDLFISIYGRGTGTTNSFGNATFFGSYANGDATSCSYTSLRGDGSSASSTRQTGQAYFVAGALPNANATSGIFGSATMHILNYSNTSTFKTILTRSSFDMNGSGGTWLTVTLYSKTPAITSLIFYDPTIAGNALKAGTQISLYGIKASAA